MYIKFTMISCKHMQPNINIWNYTKDSDGGTKAHFGGRTKAFFCMLYGNEVMLGVIAMCFTLIEHIHKIP